MTIQGCPIVVDYYVLPVAACPLILGVQWLATLRPIETNYAKLTMAFSLHGSSYVFQGLRQPTLGVLTENESGQMLNRGSLGLGFFIQLLPTNFGSTKLLTTPPELHVLLSDFSKVFQTPTMLPPHRQHDHQILLIPNSQLVSVRPYRYLHYQKSEIEK